MKGVAGLPGLTVEAPSPERVEAMLRWIFAELRAERVFRWYRARRPRAFIYAVPPSRN